MKEIFADSEEFARRVSDSLKKAGLPNLSGVELQKKYKDTPISQEVKDRHEKRLARWAARKNNQS